MVRVGQLAIEELNRYGLLKKGWKFGFDTAKVRFGCCDFTNKTITLSYSICLCNVDDNMDAIKDTIIHEIAHALAYIRYGSTRHCKKWKKLFIDIGGNGKATYDPETINEPSFNYVYECPICHGRIYRYNKIHGVACWDCCNKHNVAWSEKYVYRLKKQLKSIDRQKEC